MGKKLRANSFAESRQGLLVPRATKTSAFATIHPCAPTEPCKPFGESIFFFFYPCSRRAYTPRFFISVTRFSRYNAFKQFAPLCLSCMMRRFAGSLNAFFGPFYRFEPLMGDQITLPSESTSSSYKKSIYCVKFIVSYWTKLSLSTWKSYLLKKKNIQHVPLL